MTDTAGELSGHDFRDELKNHICGFGCGSPARCICDLASAMADEIDRLRSARSTDADVIERTRAEERERAAKFVLNFDGLYNGRIDKKTRQIIAAAIRAMGKE